uniref:Reverse transcriptase zinc-binding domain-containing protein n=1 Tax=Fagus sylvatica TaxID=28930 RepID=A0A2N9EWQ9_FAGSY
MADIPSGPGAFVGYICFKAKRTSSGEKSPISAAFISSEITLSIPSRQVERTSVLETGLAILEKFWKFLWSLSLPLKIKAFMWRACVGILPTHGLLWNRHMRIDGVCPYCNQDVESVGHALWSCTTANNVWLEFKLPGFNPVDVVHRAWSLLYDYKKVSKRFGGVEDIGIQAQSVESVAIGWCPPRVGCVKVNWAIFLELQSRQYFLGTLIRNHNSQVMGAMVMELPRLPCGIHSNVGAVIHSLQFACEMGFQEIILEGPSVSFLPPLGHAIGGFSIGDMWIEEVEVLRHKFKFFVVSEISKEINVAALALARYGRSHMMTRI